MNKTEIKRGMKMMRMVNDSLTSMKYATKNEVNALSDTYVTNASLNSIIATIPSGSGGGGNYDSDIAVINTSIAGLSRRIDNISFDTDSFVTTATFSALSAQVAENTANIAGFSVAYIGTSAPANFNGIFFKII